MPLSSWQLWLARDLVQEYRLPWQSPLENLTPGRVAQSTFTLLVEIGTPACSAKQCGKSPGWQEGKKRTPRTRYPVAKKGQSRLKKRKKKSA